ncbi:MAG: energy-coupling factor ABC transporter permease [Hungatella sp.]
MNPTQRNRMIVLIGIAMSFAMVTPAYAMHIMEGYLPLGACVTWGMLCIPFMAAGIFKIEKIVKNHRRALLIFAMVGAYAFVLSALKFPSVTGSSSHPTGMGLGALLFGPTPMAVIGFIILLFQAVLLAHGGLTTIGANTFSMAIAGPFLSFFIYRICKKCSVNKKVSIFLAVALGDFFTYCVTGIQLGFAHPSATGGVGGAILEFLGIFALTQIPLAILEGLLTVAVLIGLEAYANPELEEIGFAKEGI